MSIAPALSPEIFQACLQGKRKALEQFYSLFYPSIYRIAFLYLREMEDGKDAASMAFTKIFDRLGDFDPSQALLSTWMRRITVNICIDMLRKRNNHPLPGLEQVPEIPVAPDFDADIDFREISRFIEKMGSPMREILKLHSLEGYSHKEIAGMLAISEKYSRVALCHAKKQLISHFNSHAENEKHR